MKSATSAMSSRDEKIDKCKRDIQRLRVRVDRVRRILNTHMDQAAFRHFELRDNLEAVMRRLNMEFINREETDSPVYDTVSTSPDSD